MMRTIKFRGKTAEGKWVCGNLNVLCEEYSGIKPGHYISNSDGAPFAYQVIPGTVGQYSEVKDITGVEVYDGDVIQHKYMEREGPTHVQYDVVTTSWYP